MHGNATNAYLEDRVLSADPLELVCLLYQACTGAVRDARRHLAAGDVAARARSISKAGAIVNELVTSLDRERGGEIAERLAQLYEYMQRRLTEANTRQIDGPLAEVLDLLTTLSEAWAGIRTESRPAAREERSAQPAQAWSQMLPPEPVQEFACASQSWSF